MKSFGEVGQFSIYFLPDGLQGILSDAALHNLHQPLHFGVLLAQLRRYLRRVTSVAQAGAVACLLVSVLLAILK